MRSFLEAFGALISEIKARPLTGMEKRQVDEAEKSRAVLERALTVKGDVGEDLQNILAKLALSFSSGDWAEAKRLQMDLTSLGWSKHKSWLKGIKYIIGLARRAR